VPDDPGVKQPDGEAEPLDAGSRRDGGARGRRLRSAPGVVLGRDIRIGLRSQNDPVLAHDREPLAPSRDGRCAEPGEQLIHEIGLAQGRRIRVRVRIREQREGRLDVVHGHQGQAEGGDRFGDAGCGQQFQDAGGVIAVHDEVADDVPRAFREPSLPARCPIRHVRSTLPPEVVVSRQRADEAI
jgi:hypothetical protein